MAASQFAASLSESLSFTNDALSGVSNSIFSYINEHPLNSYVDSQSFREAVTQYSSDIKSMLANYISRATNGDATRIDNAELDFNEAVNKANNDFYDGLNSVIITDPDYSVKFQSTKAEMDTYTQSIINQITVASTDHQSVLIDASNDIRFSVNSQLSDLVFNRPLLRVVDFRYPVEVELDDYNAVELDVKNIGKKQWTGWIGVTVTDEYYKKLEFVSQVGSNYMIGPGETRTVKRDIKLPKVMTWKGEPRNLGKTLTYKVQVNTVLE